jgi:hypothetical protein
MPSPIAAWSSARTWAVVKSAVCGSSWAIA